MQPRQAAKTFASGFCLCIPRSVGLMLLGKVPETK